MKEKILSIGVNPKFDFLDFCQILKKYNNFIDSIYMSPPILLPSKHNITSRHFLGDLAGTNSYIQYINDIQLFAKDNNIKIDMAINGMNLNYNDLELILEYLLKQKPDEITLLSKYSSFFNMYYSEKTFYVYSYNSPRPVQKDFNNTFWQSYAVSNEFFWNKEIWPPNDKELRLILNTGCPAGGPPCLNTIDKTACKDNCITRYTNAAQFLAFHAWFGPDIQLFEKENQNRKYKYKLTTRNRMCDIESLNLYLDGLIYNKDIDDIQLKENNHKSYIWFCFAPFWTLHAQEVQNMDINQLRKEKEKLWGKKYIGETNKFITTIIYNSKNQKEDNQRLIKLFLKQDTKLLTEEEKALLLHYNLQIKNIDNKIIIATKMNNNILEDIDKINYKINYIDMALKKDKRYLYQLELNRYGMTTIGDYLYPLTFQGKEQKANNGYMQQKYFLLKELLYIKKEAIMNPQIFQFNLTKIKNQTKNDKISNDLSIKWNLYLNNEKIKQNNQMLNN